MFAKHNKTNSSEIGHSVLASSFMPPHDTPPPRRATAMVPLGNPKGANRVLKRKYKPKKKTLHKPHRTYCTGQQEENETYTPGGGGGGKDAAV